MPGRVLDRRPFTGEKDMPDQEPSNPLSQTLVMDVPFQIRISGIGDPG
jgi:hypothetical protein